MVNPLLVHKLVTREDAEIGHSHKLLGSAVLGHMFWRCFMIIKNGDSGLGTSSLTPLWMCIHALLHVTSFHFQLPIKRNRIHNIIWPEFRWHSMIFAYRSIIGVLLNNRTLRGPLVIGTMALADHVSKRYGQDTTMRGNPYPVGTSQKFITWHNRFYSVSQFGATMAILFRGADSAFLALLPIQTAPFFMTLAKKGIINQAEWHIFYTFMLLTNWIHALFGHGNDGNMVPTGLYMGMLVGISVARLYYSVNKYLIWFVIISIQQLALRKCTGQRLTG